MGFPGNVTAVVTYKLTDDNAIDITYSGTADKPIVLSLTNHAYFNLSGNHGVEGTKTTVTDEGYFAWSAGD